MRRRLMVVLAGAALVGSLLATDAQARGGGGHGGGGVGHVGRFGGAHIGARVREIWRTLYGGHFPRCRSLYDGNWLWNTDWLWNGHSLRNRHSPWSAFRFNSGDVCANCDTQRLHQCLCARARIWCGPTAAGRRLVGTDVFGSRLNHSWWRWRLHKNSRKGSGLFRDYFVKHTEPGRACVSERQSCSAAFRRTIDDRQRYQGRSGGLLLDRRE